MSLRINDTAPNFTAKTTQGEIDFHKWMHVPFEAACVLVEPSGGPQP